MTKIITNVNAPVRRGTPDFPCWDIKYDCGVQTYIKTYFNVQKAYSFYAYCREQIAKNFAEQQRGL